MLTPVSQLIDASTGMVRMKANATSRKRCTTEVSLRLQRKVVSLGVS